MATMQEVWAGAIERVKRSATAPNLFRALERTAPVAWEDGVFVAGLGAADGSLASVLNTSEYQLKIEQALRAATGDAELRFRLIEGTARADWEHARARDAAAAARQKAAERRARATPAAAADSWDAVMDQLARNWLNAEYRNLATGKARFIQESLALIESALPQLSSGDETGERAFSRVLERLGALTGSDPTLLALLLLERPRDRE